MCKDLDLAGKRLLLSFGQDKEKQPPSTERGKDNQTGGKHTEGRGKLPGTGGELNFKIKEEVEK